MLDTNQGRPMNLTYLELFAGAGGMSLGLETAGWRCVAHAEIEPHARAVLRHRWPDVPLYGDVAELDGTLFRGVTMVTGGSPCQDLSIAGKRAGMTEGSGTRSSLFFEQVRIWNESQAPYILWENVYGAFSSNAGRDFAAVLSALVGAAVPVPSDGWVRAGVVAGPAGVAAWRTLDAQYFGVPQRRRRVFVLGARAGGVDPAEVFALAESLSGHLAASGEAGEGIAADAGRSIASESGAGWWDDSGLARLRAEGGGSPQNIVYESDPAQGLAINISNGEPRLGDVMGTLQARASSGGVGSGAQMNAVLAFAQNTRDEVRIVSGDKVCSLAAQPGTKQQNYILAFHHTQDPINGPVSPSLGVTTDGMGVLALDIYNQSISPNGVRHTIRTGGGDAVPHAIVLRNREGKPGGGKGPLLSEGKSLTLGTSNDQVVFTKQRIDEYAEKNIGSTLAARDYKSVSDIVAGVGVPRRLTPVECERLMGWPDQHTANGINEKGKAYALADTARYKLCGNGIASPVTAWIGFQIARLLTDDK